MNASPLIFDSHLDLAWNAVSLNRDLTEPIETIRSREQGMTDTPCRGNATVCLPEMRRGRVGMCLSTLLVRVNRAVHARLRQDLDYGNQQIAFAAARGQLAYYHALEQVGEMRMIRNAEALRRHVELWERASSTEKVPVGHILSMEGADPITRPGELEEWWRLGLRVLSLVHYGVGVYAHGTGVCGGLTARGRELLGEMMRLGVILDVTHLCDQSFDEAMRIFDGPVIATHHNCRSLVPGDRQLNDEQLRLLISRDAVIGCALDNWMLTPNYIRGSTSRQGISLANAVDHIDHICQLAGNVRHVGIGSDLDGAFGTEQCPSELDTIADLQKFDGLLRDRGYSAEDVTAIFHDNWLRVFTDGLPPSD